MFFREVRRVAKFLRIFRPLPYHPKISSSEKSTTETEFSSFFMKIFHQKADRYLRANCFSKTSESTEVDLEVKCDEVSVVIV